MGVSGWSSRHPSREVHLLGLLLLAACEKSGPVKVVVSETGEGTLVGYGDGFSKPQVDLAEIDPAHCDSDANSRNKCLMFEGDITPEGWLISGCRNDGNTQGAPGILALVKDGHPTWTITDLDFSAVDADLAKQCASAPDASCNLDMPHSAHLFPDGKRLLVADTMQSRILVVTPPESGEVARVDTVLSADTSDDWAGYQFPNGSRIWEEDGRLLALVTFKGGLEANRGRIVLWDLSDQPRLLWEYPEQGFLAAVHNALLTSLPQGTFLTYGHSFGNSSSEVDGDEGSAGFARYNGPDVPPTYLGDVSGDLGFVREVEPDSDGETVLVTDSGCENPGAACERTPQVITVRFPDLTDPAKSGAWSSDHLHQQFLPVEVIRKEVTGDLSFPYEADRLP